MLLVAGNGHHPLESVIPAIPLRFPMAPNGEESAAVSRIDIRLLQQGGRDEQDPADDLALVERHDGHRVLNLGLDSVLEQMEFIWS